MTHSEQQPDSPWTSESRFYVSAISGTKWVPLVGPFRQHADALAVVSRATKIACDVDPRGHWYAYGTCQYADGSLVGKLNGYFTAELLAASCAAMTHDAMRDTKDARFAGLRDSILSANLTAVAS